MSILYRTITSATGGEIVEMGVLLKCAHERSWYLLNVAVCVDVLECLVEPFRAEAPIAIHRTKVSYILRDV